MENSLLLKWITALKSGSYQQTKESLRENSREFCALGVLADVIDPEGWSTNSEEEYTWHGNLHALDTPSNPNYLVPKEISCRTNRGIEFQARIQTWNDLGYTFPEIVGFLERGLP